MRIGHFLTLFISTEALERLGAVILIIIGCLVLFNLQESRQATEELTGEDTSNNKQSKNLFNITKILKKPTIADTDKSGVISAQEALILGLALACDSFGIGIAATLMGYSIWLTVIIVASMGGILVYLGIKFGFSMTKFKIIDKLKYLPASILIIIGLFRLI